MVNTPRALARGVFTNGLITYHEESGMLKFDGKGGVIREPKFKIIKNDTLVEYKK